MDFPVYSGDFAARFPFVREIWTVEMAEDWARVADNAEGVAHENYQ